MTTKVGNAK